MILVYTYCSFREQSLLYIIYNIKVCKTTKYICHSQSICPTHVYAQY